MNGKLPEKTSCKGYRHTESLQITYHPISVSPNLPIPNAPIPPVLQSPNPLSPNSKLLCTFTRSAWCMVIFPLSFSPLSPASAGMQQESATFTGSQCTVSMQWQCQSALCHWTVHIVQTGVCSVESGTVAMFGQVSPRCARCKLLTGPVNNKLLILHC